MPPYISSSHNYTNTNTTEIQLEKRAQGNGRPRKKFSAAPFPYRARATVEGDLAAGWENGVWSGGVWKDRNSTRPTPGLEVVKRTVGSPISHRRIDGTLWRRRPPPKRKKYRRQHDVKVPFGESDHIRHKQSRRKLKMVTQLQATRDE
jgi:hypothetical protein